MHVRRTPSFAFLAPFAALATAFAASGCGFDFAEPIPQGGTGGTAPVPVVCGQTAACPLSQECLATVENHGSPQFGLRIAELSVRSPEALSTQTLIGSYLGSFFSPNLPACFGPQGSGGPTSWLLRFDLDQETLTMGGAATPADPKQAYTFLDAMIPQGGKAFHVAPVPFHLVTNQDGSLGVSAPHEIVLPLWFPSIETGTPPSGPVALPLHGFKVSDLVVSASHDCIGHYDPAIFDPKIFCAETTPGQQYVHGGHLSASVTLEEADGIDIDLWGSFGETLCVMLAGSLKLSDRATPIAHCKRTNGVIDFKGDWCSSTNGPATATCADAVRFTADFAASAAVIDP